MKLQCIKHTLSTCLENSLVKFISIIMRNCYSIWRAFGWRTKYEIIYSKNTYWINRSIHASQRSHVICHLNIFLIKLNRLNRDFFFFFYLEILPLLHTSSTMKERWFCRLKYTLTMLTHLLCMMVGTYIVGCTYSKVDWGLRNFVLRRKKNQELFKENYKLFHKSSAAQ